MTGDGGLMVSSQGVQGAAGLLSESEAIESWRAAQGLVGSNFFWKKIAPLGCTNSLSPNIWEEEPPGKKQKTLYGFLQPKAGSAEEI